MLMLLDDGTHSAEALGRVLLDADPALRRVPESERTQLLEANCVIAPMEISLVGWLRARGSQAPVIFYGRDISREAVRAAFAAGAQEVLDPSIQPPAEMLRALTHARERHLAMPQAPTDADVPVHDIRSGSMSRDPLTGLLNHRSFVERLRDEVALSRRHGRSLALALIDIDRFSGVNSEHGFGAGDEVLQSLASRIHRIARTGDPIARVGSDELAWLMIDTGLEGADIAARRASAGIRTMPFGTAGQCTASIGISSLSDATDDVELYQFAADALQRAKSNGGDRVVAHDPQQLLL